MPAGACRKITGALCVALALLNIVGYYVLWLQFRIPWSFYVCRILPAFTLGVWVAVHRCRDHKYGIWVMAILVCFGIGDLDVLLHLHEHVILVLFRFGGAMFWLALMWMNTNRYDINWRRMTIVSIVMTAFATPMWVASYRAFHPLVHPLVHPLYYIAYNLLSTFACFLFGQTVLFSLRIKHYDRYITRMLVLAAASFLLAIWANGIGDLWHRQTHVWQLVHLSLYWLALFCLAISALLRRPQSDHYAAIRVFDEPIILKV